MCKHIFCWTPPIATMLKFPKYAIKQLKQRLARLNLFSYPRGLVIMIGLVLSGLILVAGQILINFFSNRRKRTVSEPTELVIFLLGSRSTPRFFIYGQSQSTMHPSDNLNYGIQIYRQLSFQNRFTAVLKGALKPWVHYWKLAVSRVGSCTNEDACLYRP